MSNTLLPCPWCGDAGAPVDRDTHVRCNHCGARGPILIREGNAVPAWNRRAVRDDERAHETRIVEVTEEDMRAWWVATTTGIESDAEFLNARLRARAPSASSEKEALEALDTIKFPGLASSTANAIAYELEQGDAATHTATPAAKAAWLREIAKQLDAFDEARRAVLARAAEREGGA